MSECCIYIKKCGRNVFLLPYDLLYDFAFILGERFILAGFLKVEDKCHRHLHKKDYTVLHSPHPLSPACYRSRSDDGMIGNV